MVAGARQCGRAGPDAHAGIHHPVEQVGRDGADDAIWSARNRIAGTEVHAIAPGGQSDDAADAAALRVGETSLRVGDSRSGIAHKVQAVETRGTSDAIEASREEEAPAAAVERDDTRLPTSAGVLADTNTRLSGEMDSVG